VARVTINDVAKRAGVSHTTVSWVIHDDPRITRETKARVLAAIGELRYHPNLSARSLVSGKTGVIAVVAFFFSTLFELEIMQGVERCLDSRSVPSNIHQYATRGSRERKEEIFRQILYGRRADAVICLSLRPSDELLEEFHAAGVPLVLVEERAPGAISVKTDNRAGARLAVDYLVSKGRNRIALVGDRTSGEEIGLSPQERLQGYLESLASAGLPYERQLVTDIASFDVEGGRAALSGILANGGRPDAVFSSGGDLVALGVIAEARARGLRVPEDLAVIGFDDSFVASLGTPALTTVRQPLQEMGSTAIGLALDSLEGRDVEDCIFEPHLVIRASA